jgi:hypothetical protein
MTRRDLAWRAGGALLIVLGCTASAFTGSYDIGPGIALLGMPVAFFGLVLAVQGKRVPMAIRIERSRHRRLPFAISARQRRSREQR